MFSLQGLVYPRIVIINSFVVFFLSIVSYSWSKSVDIRHGLAVRHKHFKNRFYFSFLFFFGVSHKNYDRWENFFSTITIQNLFKKLCLLSCLVPT